ncbi:MAG: hypothetical protein JWP22_397 [Ramlibacter sp.]|nr:hypothetical protein [Ramlibacter sp.]
MAGLSALMRTTRRVGRAPGRPRRLALLAWLLASLASLAQAQGAREAAIKAAFLYKFGSFVEWPAASFPAPSTPFVIGIYGDEQVAQELAQITQGRDIDGHPVSVQRVHDSEEAAALHILFAGGARDARIRELLAAVRGPVLTVTEGGVGARPGAVLFFLQDEGRVRFGASLTAAAARGLKLSARLLEVAQMVEGR